MIIRHTPSPAVCIFTAGITALICSSVIVHTLLHFLMRKILYTDYSADAASQMGKNGKCKKKTKTIATSNMDQTTEIQFTFLISVCHCYCSFYHLYCQMQFAIVPLTEGKVVFKVYPAAATK